MPRRRLPHLAAIAAAAVLAVGCGRPPAREARRDARAPASPFEPDSVEIVDHWMGLDPQGPIHVVYHLRRQGGTHTFTGEGSLTRGNRRKSGPLSITVPASAMRAFLRGLAAAPRAPGAYVPNIEHTDDYPQLTIRLRAGPAVAEFFSQSQGDGHRPWRVTLGGRRYVSDSAAPADALRQIQPYLRRAELDRMEADDVGAASPK